MLHERGMLRDILGSNSSFEKMYSADRQTDVRFVQRGDVTSEGGRNGEGGQNAALRGDSDSDVMVMWMAQCRHLIGRYTCVCVGYHACVCSYGGFCVSVLVYIYIYICMYVCKVVRYRFGENVAREVGVHVCVYV